MRATVCLTGLAAIIWHQTAAGQVIQLPSFHSFSVDTTVVVPDAGRATIAGNKQGRTSASRVGSRSANRSIGVDRQAAGARALATIHDPHEADAALGRRAQAPLQAPIENSARTTAPWAGRTPATDRAVQSVTSIERERASRRAAIERETLALVGKARAAAAGGKPGVATIYYQRAAAQATGGLEQTIAAERAKLNRKSAASRAGAGNTIDGRSVAGARR